MIFTLWSSCVHPWISGHFFFYGRTHFSRLFGNIKVGIRSCTSFLKEQSVLPENSSLKNIKDVEASFTWINSQYCNDRNSRLLLEHSRIQNLTVPVYARDSFNSMLSALTLTVPYIEASREIQKMLLKNRSNQHIRVMRSIAIAIQQEWIKMVGMHLVAMYKYAIE